MSRACLVRVPSSALCRHCSPIRHGMVYQHGYASCMVYQHGYASYHHGFASCMVYHHGFASCLYSVQGCVHILQSLFVAILVQVSQTLDTRGARGVVLALSAGHNLRG